MACPTFCGRGCSHQTLPPCGQLVQFSQQLVSICCGQHVQRPRLGGSKEGSELSTPQHLSPRP